MAFRSALHQLRRGAARSAMPRANPMQMSRVQPFAMQQRMFSSGGGNTLVLAEHDNATLNPATLSAITAASQLGGDVTVLVAGANCQGVADAASKVKGVANVLLAEDPALEHFVAENYSALLEKIQSDKSFVNILAPATTTSKNVLPRFAVKIDVQPIVDVLKVESADTFQRPVYAGNAISTVKSSDAVKVLTIRPTNFEKAEAEGGSAAIETYAADGVDAKLTTWEKDELSKSDRPSLTAARVVVSGGRALKDADNFKMLESLADQLKGAVGASRAAVDAGYAPNDYQVGQTGKVVAPEVYFAVGISGAIQHLAGMKDSKVIVAINKDPEAPIFSVADYGLVGDLFKIVPELQTKLE